MSAQFTAHHYIFQRTLSISIILNLPNLLTLSRIPILFMIVALLYLPFGGAKSAALILFLLGALTDWADGYYARKMGLVSNFGKLMDALTDKVFIVGLFMALLTFRVLPEWSLPLLLLIVSREFLITGLRLVAASSGIVLGAEKSGKHKTVSQIISAILLLLAIALQADWQTVCHPAVTEWVLCSGILFFIIATCLTVSSGTRYMIKYWAVFTGQNESKSQ